MTELEELKLAYTECSRQRNELLNKLKSQVHPAPVQQEPLAGKESYTSADNYGAAYETSAGAPFTDGDPNDGY